MATRHNTSVPAPQPADRTAEIAGLLAQLGALLAEREPPAPPAPRPMPARMLMTAEEAAEQLGIGRTLMYRLIRTGDIESVQIGRLRRIPQPAIDEYARKLVNSTRTAAATNSKGARFYGTQEAA